MIHDPLDQPVLPPRALVLGVGVHTPARSSSLLRDLGEQGAAGLVLRAPVPLTDEVRAAADESGVAVLGLSRGAPWGHLAEMLRSLLAEGDVAVAESESLGGLPSGDLFAVANAVASLLDAPITIEDRNSRVLAFSGRQDEADPSRVETILGRQVPERYSRILHERGVFRELLRSDRPVFIEPPTPDGNDGFSLPRVAIAVRAGDEVLGSIWAAVNAPLSDERTEALCESAKLVALHLLRVRAGADVQRRVRADLLSSALEGRSRCAARPSGGSASRGQPLLVLGVALDERAHGRPDADSAAVEHERQRLSDAFAHAPGSRALAVGGRGDRRSHLRATAPHRRRRGSRGTGSAGRPGLPRPRRRPAARPRRGRSGGAATWPGWPTAGRRVDRVLRVLREGRGDRRIGRLDELQGEALILELRDLAAARGDEPTGALARLVDYDRAHRGNLVETLRAWLDAFGDVVAAADSVFVHQNTFRYRLRRVAEVGQMDLTDPDQRFAAMLQLRILRIESAGDH